MTQVPVVAEGADHHLHSHMEEAILSMTSRASVSGAMEAFELTFAVFLDKSQTWVVRRAAVMDLCIPLFENTYRSVAESVAMDRIDYLIAESERPCNHNVRKDEQKPLLTVTATRLKGRQKYLKTRLTLALSCSFVSGGDGEIHL